MHAQTPLTLKDVADSFGKIAEASGKGSRLEKHNRLKELVERADSQERPILLRLLHNELRIGLHDGLIQEAIARASGTDLKTVRRAALFLSDLAEVAVDCSYGRNDRPSAGRHQTFRSAAPDALRAFPRFQRNLHGSRRKDSTRVQVRRS